QPIGLALFVLTITFAPSIGPTIGGWLTSNYSWQYVFTINIVPGILLFAALYWALDSEPWHLERLREGDWFGIASMAVGLACLQVVLEEGNRQDWLASPWISTLSAISAISLVLFLVRE